VLTRAEKAIGRAWRAERLAALQALNAENPPGELVPPFGRHFRHNCAARQGRSTSFELKERYDRCPDAPLGWIWKEGKCACGLTARSSDGYVVDARERPPLGRTA
jgi:hypothetical protein